MPWGLTRFQQSGQGNAEEEPAVEPNRTAVVARASLATPGQLPTGRLTGTASDAGSADRELGPSGTTSRRSQPAGQTGDDATGSRSEHGAGVRTYSRLRHHQFG